MAKEDNIEMQGTVAAHVGGLTDGKSAAAYGGFSLRSAGDG